MIETKRITIRNRYDNKIVVTATVTATFGGLSDPPLYACDTSANYDMGDDSFGSFSSHVETGSLDCILLFADNPGFSKQERDAINEAIGALTTYLDGQCSGEEGGDD